MLLALSFIPLITLPAFGQEDPVEWSLQEAPSTVTAGEWSEVTVRATLESGWHIYSLTQPGPPIATQLRVGPDDIIRSRFARQPSPTERFDPAFDMETEFFEDEVDFRIPFMVTRNIVEERELVVDVTYQACNDRICLPPTDEELHFTLGIEAAEGDVEIGATLGDDDADGAEGGARLPSISLGGAGSESADDGRTDAAADADTDESALLSGFGQGESWGSFLLLAVFMGALTLLTPCVFPMIPITVSYFTNRGGSGAAGAATAASGGVDLFGGRVTGAQVRDAILYGGGIVVAFSGLGLLLALVYGATGINRFATNPWINLLVAGIFIGFAFNLLGTWQIRLPWRLANLLHSRSEGGGIGGLLFMGIAFAITTFTCTVPFVGTLLVAAADGAWTRPVIGLLVFSSILALPFIFLALFPALVKSLPKSGGWMGSLMVVLGLIELGAALKFLSNADLIWQWGILHREVVLALWIALSVLTALYLFRQIQLPSEVGDEKDKGVGVGRMLAGGAFLALALFLMPGLFGRHVGEVDAFLPPAVYPGTGGSSSASAGSGGADDGTAASLDWYTDYEEALAVATSTGKPMFIDFTGYTCTNCRWMEANMFTRADVRERFSQYVMVQLYTDGRGENYTRNQNMQRDRFGTVALPLYVVLDSEGETIAAFPGLTRNPKEYLEFLDKGLAKQGERQMVMKADL